MGRKVAGRRVAIVGAGGIGFDVGEFLTAGAAPDGHASLGRDDDPAIAAFRDEWGIDVAYGQRGGLMPPHDHASVRRLWLLQRKDEKVGAGLAKTTGWIRRALLKKRGVAMVAGVRYDRIDDLGLHITVDGQSEVLDVDTIVICAGQEPRRELVAGLEDNRILHQLIGGADVALELDAKRAIDQERAWRWLCEASRTALAVGHGGPPAVCSDLRRSNICWAVACRRCARPGVIAKGARVCASTGTPRPEALSVAAFAAVPSAFTRLANTSVRLSRLPLFVSTKNGTNVVPMLVSAW